MGLVSLSFIILEYLIKLVGFAQSYYSGTSD